MTALVTAVRIETDVKHGMGVDIRIVATPDPLICEHEIKADSVPAEVRDALLCWLLKGDDRAKVMAESAMLAAAYEQQQGGPPGPISFKLFAVESLRPDVHAQMKALIEGGGQ